MERRMAKICCATRAQRVPVDVGERMSISELCEAQKRKDELCMLYKLCDSKKGFMKCSPVL